MKDITNKEEFFKEVQKINNYHLVLELINTHKNLNDIAFEIENLLIDLKKVIKDFDQIVERIKL